MKKSLVKKVVSQTKKNKGFSVNAAAKSPTKGYMVSLGGHEKKVPLSKFNDKVVSAYLAQKQKLLWNPDNFLGTWVDGGFVYMDISVNMPNKKAAMKFGATSGQLAIYDVIRGKSINLPKKKAKGGKSRDASWTQKNKGFIGSYEESTITV